MNNTKERPIALTAQEVNAVLAGDKTQHRVPIKMRYGSPDFLGSRDCNKSDPSLWGWDNFEDSETRVLSNEPCPFGVVGDRLWVRETHHAPDFLHDYEVKELAEGFITLESLGVTYKADAPHMTPADGGWCSPVGMPRWASRLLLEITDIRIERVHDITHNDSVAEYCFNFGEKKKQCIPPLTGFCSYWRERYGDDVWRSNPWVWVIEFKVVEPSEVQGG